MSDTLVNLSLMICRINVHEQFGTKCLELGKMNKLKKIKIDTRRYAPRKLEEVKDVLRKNLPNVTIVENRQKENFFIPADSYAKHDISSGFWEISCNRINL